jgi:SAM-dependent methyltransferase
MGMTDRHDDEAQRNLERWRQKPVLQAVYRGFHELIARQLARNVTGMIVELGSGIGSIKESIPDCIRTDLFPGPGIDRVENAYRLSMQDGECSNLVAFDVFHHLRYPGTALEEFRRVLLPGGRLLLFEPCVSALGLLVYGLGHAEPLGLNRPIEWNAPQGWCASEAAYYAAQGNASRIFLRRAYERELTGWDVIVRQRLAAISYVASGGYSRAQLYPERALPAMRAVDRFCDHFPLLFATRLLVVLAKRAHGKG